MALITLTSEDCELIEKCIDMISMQCRMIGDMLRRSRDASSAGPDRRYEAASPESGETALDMLSHAVGTLSSTVKNVSGHGDSETNGTDIWRSNGTDHGGARKRHRPGTHPSRGGSGSYEDLHMGSNGYNGASYNQGYSGAMPRTATPPPPPPAKRRGRPPRDYGDELAPAFSMYASDHYAPAEQAMLARSSNAPGTRLPKNEVLRCVWDQWWVSAQNVKDRYLARSRQEMHINETHMLELLIDFPLPQESVQATMGKNAPSFGSTGRSPEPSGSTAVDPFNVFLREQLPLLREKVPDWSDAEIHRRLTVEWNSMTSDERSRYNVVTPSGSSNMMRHNNGFSPRSKMHSAPRRAYVLFCRQERPLVVEANPEWDLPAVNKELGRKWKDLLQEEKQVFFDMERKEAEARANSGAMSPNSPGSMYHHHRGSPMGTPNGAVRYGPGGVRAMRPGTPNTNPNKGPSRAYVTYSRQTRKSITSAHKDWDLATVNRELGRLWKAMTPEERHRWETSANDNTTNGTSPSGADEATPARTESSPSAMSSVSAAPGGGETNGQDNQISSDATNSHGFGDYNMEMDGEGEVEDIDLQDDDDYSTASRVGGSVAGQKPHESSAVSSEAASLEPKSERMQSLVSEAPSALLVSTAPPPPPMAKPAVVSEISASPVPALNGTPMRASQEQSAVAQNKS